MDRIEHLTDLQLLEELMHDNHRAFKTLYNRYKHNLFHFIIRLSHGDYSLAEEVVQQSFIAIWENRKKLTIEQSFSNYLKVVSRNLFLKETARRVNEQLIVSRMYENRLEAENYVDDEVELSLLMEEVERIIAMLPPARQRVYRLRHIEHLTHKEIAQQLGIAEGTVESHMKQSTKFLKLMLKTTHREMLNGITILATTLSIHLL